AHGKVWWLALGCALVVACGQDAQDPLVDGQGPAVVPVDAGVDGSRDATAAPPRQMEAGTEPAAAGTRVDAGGPSRDVDGSQGAAVLGTDAGSLAASAGDDSGAVAALEGGIAAGAADLWIAPDGDDGSAGTQASPLRSLALAAERVAPGATVWISDGTYREAQTIPLKRNGEEGRPIRLFAAPGVRPVFDFSAQTQGDGAARGIAISGTYFHLRGFEVTKAGDNCIHISGSHNTVENLVIHACGDSGLQITANSSDAADPTRAAHNTVLNTDSYANYDAANQGENADGFAAKLYIGPGNVFRGCRAWNNADDGWDLFAADDAVTIDHCWAIANGKIGPAQNNTNGDGNGFKLGGAAKAGDSNMGGAVHTVTNCISVENVACGYTRNNNTRVPALSMCGGRGDGKGLLCSLSSQGSPAVTMSAAQAVAVKRGPEGELP
ncbi:MAG: hypothetical protein RL385_4468, partial [Pseudomonadota bacterium]